MEVKLKKLGFFDKFVNDAIDINVGVFLQKEIKELKENNKILENKIDSLKEKNNSLQKEVSYKTSEIAKLEENVKQLRDANNLLKEAKNKVEESKTSIEAILETEKIGISNLKLSLEEKNYTIEKLNKEISDLKNDLEAAKSIACPTKPLKSKKTVFNSDGTVKEFDKDTADILKFMSTLSVDQLMEIRNDILVTYKKDVRITGTLENYLKNDKINMVEKTALMFKAASCRKRTSLNSWYKKYDNYLSNIAKA